MASASAQKNWRPERPPSLGRKRPRKCEAWPRAGRDITLPRLASTEICAMQQSAAGGVAFLPRVRPVTAMMQPLRCSSFPPPRPAGMAFRPPQMFFRRCRCFGGGGQSADGKAAPLKAFFLAWLPLTGADGVSEALKGLCVGLSGASGGAEVAAIERKES